MKSNYTTTIKCNKCKCPISSNLILKEKRKEIIIALKEVISLTKTKNSCVGRCIMCNEDIGFSNTRLNHYILLKNKCEIKTLIIAKTKK